MNKYIALFRGINVGGRNILPMKDLKNILEELNCTNVTTYIQSGNVVFNYENDSKKIINKIQSAILNNFGFKPTLLLFTSKEFITAVNNNPFTSDTGKTIHFFFSSVTPANPDLLKLNELKSESEKYKLIGNLFYLHAPEGIGRSKLAAAVERCLGVPVTARNLNTVNKIISLIGI
ncbi:MAG: DUF1697 domain-containing protein [Ignavibacteriae bacterium]|nr:DUF1697 domain-containing protein [Ignavibacteriota bacterium]NOG99584.1 DUF1697 domain-containing protein [Ignavibacteriota bacterium]